MTTPTPRTDAALADLANCQRDVHELLRLLGEIRFATGDRGKRNQAELVAHCADLAKRAAVLEKVRAYPYIPSGLAAMIERELNTTTP